jgi:hypothetical protein
VRAGEPLTDPVHPLRFHGRYPYSAITRRPDYAWPKSRRLAVYVGFNVEHFAFGAGLGACIGPKNHEPDVLNYSWRDYGNRVGVWRCLDLFGQLGVKVGAIINTALYDYCPEVIEACVKRGDELIGHGHTNSERQGEMTEMLEKALLKYCRERIQKSPSSRCTAGSAPGSRRASSPRTSCTRPATLQLELVPRRPAGRDEDPGWKIWAIPYSQELNDIPAIIHRQDVGERLRDLVVDNFEEMLEQSRTQPLVMGIALHPYIVGQPHRLRHLRRALQHIVKEKRVWFTTPGAIAKWVSETPTDDTGFFT